MKIDDILDESVIDFSKFKQSKQPIKTVKTVANLSKHDNTVATVNDHLELLIDYINDIKSQIRIPHFNNLDDIFFYINTTLRYPFYIGSTIVQDRIEDWYNALEFKNKTILDMIAHYCPRLLKVLNAIESKINDFVKSVPKTVKMPDRVRYLQSMIQHDKSVLKELERLIQ